jgi:hypothetical protein
MATGSVDRLDTNGRWTVVSHMLEPMRKPQIHVLNHSPTERCAGEVGLGQISTRQIGSVELRIHQPSTTEVSTGKVCTLQAGVGQIRPLKIRPFEVDTFQTTVAQISATQVGDDLVSGESIAPGVPLSNSSCKDTQMGLVRHAPDLRIQMTATLPITGGSTFDYSTRDRMRCCG